MGTEEVWSNASNERRSDIELELRVLENLKNGVYALQNGSGSFRCPFCVGMNSQEFRYEDLLRHATWEDKGNRSIEAEGNHRALVLFLKTEITQSETFFKGHDPRPMKHTSNQQKGEEFLVWPWMGVIVNIDNRRIMGGKHLGPGNGELKIQFSSFDPKSVRTLWNFHGHSGIAIIEFGGDMIGFGNAQRLERNFAEIGRGRKGWQKVWKLEPCIVKNDLYGWVANQEDYKRNDLAGKYLRKRGNLRTVSQVIGESSRKQDQLLHSLNITIQEKNMQLNTSKGKLLGLTNLVFQACLVRREAEAEKKKMEEQHKKELQTKEEESKILLRKCKEDIFKERLELNDQLNIIKKRCEELENQDARNEENKTIQVEKKNRYEEKIRKVLDITELSKKQEAEQIKLLKKHEEEYKDLFCAQHLKTKQLLHQQNLELNIQSLEAKITTENLKEGEMEKDNKINPMKEELESLRDEKSCLEEMNKNLTCKERELNNELEEAFKEALQIMKACNHSRKFGIGIKQMGKMNMEAWKDACKRIFKNDWELKMETLVSIWQAKLSDPNWYPFKVIACGDGNWEKNLNTEDESIIQLRREYGDAVLESVVTALKELDDYNTSGRYPVSLIWNFTAGKKATMKEILISLSSTTESNKRIRMHVTN